MKSRVEVERDQKVRAVEGVTILQQVECHCVLNLFRPFEGNGVGGNQVSCRIYINEIPLLVASELR